MFKSFPIVIAIVLFFGCATKEEISTTEDKTTIEVKENSAIKATIGEGAWWIKRHQTILDRLDTNAELILVGNSIFHTLDEGDRKEVWEKYLTRYQTINMGISGDRTENVIWRLENGTLNNLNPKVAVILIGTNNTDGNHFLEISTPEELAEGIWKICSMINDKLPSTQILLMGILPYGYKPNYRDNINKATNKLIAKFPEKNGKIHYVDIGKVYYDALGKVKPELMPDYLHPNAEGHLLMFKALAPHIAKLME